jgi:hypothetical protein
MLSIRLLNTQITIAISNIANSTIRMIERFFFSIIHQAWNFYRLVKLACSGRDLQILQVTMIGQAVDKNWTDDLMNWK